MTFYTAKRNDDDSSGISIFSARLALISWFRSILSESTFWMKLFSSLNSGSMLENVSVSLSCCMKITDLVYTHLY